jgi:hypothetical protein
MMRRVAAPDDLPNAASGGETKVAYTPSARTVFSRVSTPEVPFSESQTVIKEKHDLTLHQQGHPSKKQKRQRKESKL